MSAARDFLRRQRDLALAERVFAEFFKEAVARPGATREDVLPYLTGRLNLDDALYQQWQALPRGRS